MLLHINVSTADIHERSTDTDHTNHPSTLTVTGENYEETRTQEGELVEWFQVHPTCVGNIAWESKQRYHK